MLRTRLAVVAAILAVGGLSCGSEATTEPNILTIDAGIPNGWVLVGGQQATYVVGLDTRNAHGGHAALAIGGTDTSVLRFNGVGQILKADAYRGKRVRLSGWVRQVGIAGSDIGLWMRIDGGTETLGFDNFSTRPLIGTADWHQVEVILDVPPNALGIALGVLMSGKGELLVDDMAFEVIPATGPTTNQLLMPTPVGTDSATMAALYANLGSVPINLNFELR